MPGPPPKPESERRRRNAPMANTVRLPAQGRKGKPPQWPLGGRAPRGWVELWKKPQAIMWERCGDELVVARYLVLRNLLQYPEDASKIQATALGQLQRLEDALGLNPISRLKLRWEIVDGDVEEPSETPTSVKSSADVTARRSRLKVVANDP
ncbi:hypothetical protein ACFLIN_03810 [Corynebacterium kutscheri]|uniref:phage terminase small subunit n=1 Tax=Corynebacterium kutscheri TaxID=35755 RepID=UPI0037C02053